MIPPQIMIHAHHPQNENVIDQSSDPSYLSCLDVNGLLLVFEPLK